MKDAKRISHLRLLSLGIYQEYSLVFQIQFYWLQNYDLNTFLLLHGWKVLTFQFKEK